MFLNEDIGPLPEALNNTVNAYRNGEMGVNEAVVAFGIPKTTFKRRLKSNNYKNTNRSWNPTPTATLHLFSI